MSIDNTILRINYDLMYDDMYPLACLVEQSGILRCAYTWLQAKDKPNFLHRLIKNLNTRGTSSSGKIVWFQNGDPYKGSKPFKILWVGLEGGIEIEAPATVILVVDGKKTDRIKKKWTGKLAAVFGYAVNIIWEENAQ